MTSKGIIILIKCNLDKSLFLREYNVLVDLLSNLREIFLKTK